MRPSWKLLLYLAAIGLISYIGALLITPLVPYDFFKVGRRVATIAAAVLLIPFVRHALGWRLQDLGLSGGRAWWRDLWRGMAIGAVVFGTLVLIHALVLGTAQFRWPTPDGWLSMAGFLPAALLIALLEETFFRGVVMRTLQRDLGLVLAVILSSALYSVLHFVKYVARPLEIVPELFGLFVLGCILAYAAIRTRWLAVSIGVHMSAAYLAKVDRYALDFLGREPAWLYGTDRWVTGVVGWSALGLMCALMHWSSRGRVGTAGTNT